MKKFSDVDEGTIRRLDWQELLPWTLFLRVFPFSFSVRLISIGTLFLFLFNIFQFVPIAEKYLDFQRFFFFPMFFSVESELTNSWFGVCGSCFSGFMLGRFFFLLISFAGLLFLGGTVARMTAERIAKTQTPSLLKAIRQTVKHFLTDFLVLIIPALLIGLGYLALFTIRPDVCPILTPLVLGFGLLGTVFATVFVFAAPLMIASVAADESHAFDAFAHGFSFVCQRPLHFAFYLLLAAFLGWFGFQIVGCLTEWMLLALLPDLMIPDYSLIENSAWILFSVRFFQLIPLGYLLIYYFFANTVIYFLLRRSVDGVSIEVMNNSSPSKTDEKSLKPILRDIQGAEISVDTVSKECVNTPKNN